MYEIGRGYDSWKETPPECGEEYYIRCDVCGQPIYYWEDDQEYCIEIDEKCICEDCIKVYMQDNYKKSLSR